MTAINVEDHLGLAWHTTIQWSRWWFKRDVNIEDDDMLSEAYMALMRAAKQFNPDKGVKFSTYATQAIRNALWEWVNVKNRAHPCKYGVHRHCMAIIKYREEHGRDPTKEELEKLIKRRIVKDETFQKYLGDVEIYQSSLKNFSTFRSEIYGEDNETDEDLVERYRFTDRHHNGSGWRHSHVYGGSD